MTINNTIGDKLNQATVFFMWTLTCMIATSVWASPDSPPQRVEAKAAPAAAASADLAASRASDAAQGSLAADKANYLYQFLGYVEFPRSSLPQPDSPLVIGVLGSDDVYDALADVLAGKTIKSRAVLRKRLSEGDSLSGIHLLFTGKKVDINQNATVKAARAAPILLVTESAEGLTAGAVFNFLDGGTHLHFEASLDAANRASLKISSRVLALAERVIGGR